MDRDVNSDEAALPFRNPNLPDEARIDDLVSRLTLDEKISCLSTNPRVPRLNLAGSGHVEGLHGLALGGPGKWGKETPVTTTTFPQAIGLAQTWNIELLTRLASAEAREARFVFHRSGGEQGGIVVRAPNADLGRDPRWGRTEECYGEDAFLSRAMTIAFVRGLQGDHPRYWQAASLLKHFLANSNEDGREASSSDFDETLLREYYAATFEGGIVEGGARAYMAAYNAYNGVPCAVHPILQSLTIDEWKQDGIVCTDGGAFKMLVNNHHAFASLPEAAAAAIHAGITQFLDDYRDSVQTALETGLLSQAALDRALRGNFRVMLKLGLWDPPELVPYTVVGDQPPWETREHRELARLAAQESIVLLKNENRTLPLVSASLREIAVIGKLSADVFLDWYSGTPPYVVAPLEGIRTKVGPSVQVHYVDGESADEAERAARSADVAIVCLGNHPTGDAPWAEVTRPSYGKEAVDRRSLSLEDEPLIERILAANPRTILVLLSSFPYALGWSEENVPAIVHSTHSGQELGTALADVLFGAYNPAGRLVQTWPRSLQELPPMLDYDIRRGRTYRYFEGAPLYPFGHGLSYTTFRYFGLETSARSLSSEGELKVRVQVQNIGEHAGDEVVQLYVARSSRAARTPRKQLAAFARIHLGPAESRAVELTLRASDIRRWDPGERRFRLDEGELEIQLGQSSERIELRTSIVVVESSE